MSDEHLKFYNLVKQTVAADPDMAEYAITGLVDGLRRAAAQARKDQCDWEAVAMTALHGRMYNSGKGDLADRIERLAPRAAFDWSEVVSKMKKGA